MTFDDIEPFDSQPEDLDATFRLGPKDMLAVCVSGLTALSSPFAEMTYPEWKEDAVRYLVKGAHNPIANNPLDTLGNLMTIIVDALVVAARINKWKSEQSGIPLDPRDESEIISDPADLLEMIISQIPPDEHFEQLTETVKTALYGNDEVNQLEEWFNGPEAEEPPNA